MAIISLRRVYDVLFTLLLICESAYKMQSLQLSHHCSCVRQNGLTTTKGRALSMSNASSSSMNCQLETRRITMTPLYGSQGIEKEEYEGDDDDDSSLSTSSIVLFGVLPALSIAFPVLIQAKLLIPLLVVKRLYIYSLALAVVCIAGARGARDSPSLGTRVIDLTQEILPAAQDTTDVDQRFEEFRALDDMEDAGTVQAVSLPLVVASSLVTSVFFLGIQNSDLNVEGADNSEVVEAVISVVQSIKEFLPTLISLSNVAVVTLFTRAELKRIPFLANNQLLTTGAAVALSGLAFLGPSNLVWPVQNLLCICLAISVSRVIQLPGLLPILLALSGLVVYDVGSVAIQLIDLGSASLAAADGAGTAGSSTLSTGSLPSAAASSAMGAVALSKAGVAMSSSATPVLWQPGLFQVRLNGATDLLGLGDAVFPSLLSIFCRRFDEENRDDQTGYFVLSLVGFALGCLACEFVPGISSSGLPALLFIVPSMLITVLGTSVFQGEFRELWEFDCAKDEEMLM